MTVRSNPATPVPPLRRSPAIRWVARQYARNRLPGASVLLRWCGVLWGPHWRDAPTAETREKHAGSRIRLDLSDQFQRIAYYRGCYHEFDILATAKTCIRPGDHALDGGANIGLVTLYLAHLVTPSGRVIAVEPGPRALGALRWHVQQNNLPHVRIEPVGLSDETAEHEYQVPDFQNLGAGTLGPTAPRFRGRARDRTTVHSVRGDQLLKPADSAPLFIKLDIEGFELRALRGLEHTIRCRRPAILCEINPETLRLNDASPAQIAGFLRPLGYEAFGIRELGFFRARALRLHQLADADLSNFRDALFLHPDSVHWRRAARHLRFHEGPTNPDLGP